MNRTAVVILNWNGTAHLRRFLPSVVDNTPAGVRIIVADNGSTDDSLAVLEQEFGSVEVLRLDRNYGFAEGYNRALAQVEAEYCVLLNSDVETPQGWLEPLVARLDEDESVAAVAPKLLWSEAREQFEYAGASGGFIDFLGYPFCRGRIMMMSARSSGQVVLHSVADLRCSNDLVDLLRISLLIWRRLTSAGVCSWRDIRSRLSRAVGFTTTAEVRLQPIRQIR